MAVVAMAGFQTGPIRARLMTSKIDARPSGVRMFWAKCLPRSTRNATSSRARAARTN
jgi:hypothetical protein